MSERRGSTASVVLVHHPWPVTSSYCALVIKRISCDNKLFVFTAKTAKALRGERRTTRLHRLCSGKIKLRDEWTKDKSIYDKIICGMFTRKDEYKKYEEHVARLLSGQIDKSLDEQKAELIKAVNQMVHAAGPIPILQIKG